MEIQHKEAEKVITFINWIKEYLDSKISVPQDFDNFGVSGHILEEKLQTEF